VRAIESSRLWACWLAAALQLPPASALGGTDPLPATAPRTEFAAPAPGSYRLARIQPVADAVLLDAGGVPRHLRKLLSGKVNLLTFFYSSCPDPLGCPFAFALLRDLHHRLANRPGVAGQLRFVSISMDPVHDVPAVLHRYAGETLDRQDIEWQYLTARSVPELLPVLEDFGQDVSVDVDAHGRPTRVLHHMLKMFLIDANGEIREIYSLSFMQPEVIANDVRTLLMEHRPVAR
jgi:cytochrome oxidase Cu insertion factor (SCO1/SenC/PrrC family)